MSEIKVNKITPRASCGTTQLGDSGDTFTIPVGATITNLGTASGFGATGAVNWDVASIKTTDFTAVSGNGYFVDTATTGAVIVTLPAAPSVGDVVGVADYANNFATANCTLNRNSLLIGGVAVDATLKVNGVAVTLVYVDVTKGWIVTDSGNQTDAPTSKFVAATGGCVTCCGNYKVHTFLAPGTFTITCAGNAAGSNVVDYMVVAGGGSSSQGGSCTVNGAGGGGGGYRESVPSPAAWTGSPLANPAGGLSVCTSPGAYPIVVGAGGARVPGDERQPGLIGVDSVFSTITSAGGGAGRNSYPSMGTCGTTTANGGSGGGGGASWPSAASTDVPGGNGNSPPRSPPQGMPGGKSTCNHNAGGGGGGATVAGGASSMPDDGGAGGAGATTEINFSPNTYSGGGGGAGCGTGGAAGPGGGGAGGVGAPSPVSGVAGGVNVGGGAGGGALKTAPGSVTSYNAAGGSGIVILRYKYQ